jgi:hypothetical protein
MDSLYQRLRELDAHTFQILCFHILKERFPGIELKHVDGAAGDEGLDVFAGELAGRPAIWQCKSFARIGESQKGQIRASLKTALKHFSPEHWILCLSIDLDARTHRWFEKWKQSNAKRVKIGLLPAAEIAHELMYRRTIRHHFFPTLDLDSVELKRIVSGSDKLTPEELEKLTEDNLEDFVERLKERDARFNFQIVFDGDLGPTAREGKLVPGLVMSITSGTKTINVFVRDHDALRSNPVTLELNLKGAGVEKHQTLLKTGHPQEFLSDEFEPMASSTPLLTPLLKGHGPQSRLTISPSPAMTQRKRIVRLRFYRSGHKEIEYPLMDLSPVRIGNDEAEFRCSGEGLPFEMSAIIPPPQKMGKGRTGSASKINFHYHSAVGFEVKELKKFLDALALLATKGGIEIFDLKSQTVIMKWTFESNDAPAMPTYHAVVNDLAQIAVRFKVDLRFPGNPSDKDLETIVVLKQTIEGGTLPVNNISSVVVKDEGNRESLPQQLANQIARLKMVYPRMEPRPVLFGTTIDTGPYAMEFDAQIIGLDATLEQFRKAAIGDVVPFSFRPTGPVRFSLLSEEEVKAFST